MDHSFHSPVTSHVRIASFPTKVTMALVLKALLLLLLLLLLAFVKMTIVRAVLKWMMVH